MTSQVSHDTLVGRARALRGGIEARAEQVEAERSVAPETIAELKQAGLFRAFQPARFSGLEASPAEFFGAVIEVGSACPSTAWVLAVIGIHAFELANLSLELQEEIWGKDQDTLVSSSYAIQGVIRRVPGGVRASGRWKSSSGVDHVGWVVLGATEEGEDGAARAPWIIYVPRSEFTILDDWYVMGLGGTGSKSVVLDDVFVPDHRAVRRSDQAAKDPPWERVNASPLYKLPQMLMYLIPGAAPAIGAAKGAYREYRKQLLARSRPKMDGSLVRDDPFVQKRLADAKYGIDRAEVRLLESCREMLETVESGRELSPEALARYNWDFSRPADDCVTAVRGMFETLGASVVYATNPLQRFYRDLLTMRQHGTQDPYRGALAVARVELGFDESPGTPSSV